MANWSELPEEIIDLVAKRLPPYPNEFARFSCVCKSWNSVVKKQKSNIIRFAPWLMLARSKNDKQFKKGAIRSFYCHSTKRLFNYYLPQAKRTRCWGTPYGWLLTFGLDLKIHLLHPLSRVQISLPSQPTFEHQHQFDAYCPEHLCQSYFTKFALSSDPSIPESGQCPLVMAIYGEIRYLAVASPGDEVWTSVDCSRSNYQDIIFFNGHFYAISCDGMLRIIEVNTRQPKATDFASPPDNVYICSRFYLVELSGDLYMVERAFDTTDDLPTIPCHNETTYFVVYRFDFRSKAWTEVEDLGDHALFLGNNTSFAISTSDYPEFKENCIYFTDDHSDFYPHGFCDMGIYDIENNTIEPFNFDDHQLSTFSRPVFFMPTL
ncbi:hypothetical protein AQUCO_09600032v1 [Aquilegia coerulea]|uniref:F-box domain-containing protein n=1 Tax=Aquilegia coerulea TaxID=218851 RepID=A0A2G5C4I0_AQUCA|nr:hypothetical protein AQUCO_09600032v1 [Aquilegia coerulea]